MNEEWRPVDGSPGYLVSNSGSVMSPSGKRLIPLSNGRYGYLSVSLARGRREYVHRLVASAFIGSPVGMDVDHIDGNVSNNSLGNLRILTHAENMISHRERVFTCKKGHSLANAYWDPRGRRQCRECRRAADHRRRPGRRNDTEAVAS